MTYTEQIFVKGQVLKAEHLNKIEQGIKSLDNRISSTSNKSTTCVIGTYDSYTNGGEAGPSVSPFILGDYASLQGNKITGIKLMVAKTGTITVGVKPFNAQQNFTRTLFIINATSTGEKYYDLTSYNSEITFVDAEIGNVYINFGECLGVMLPTDTGNFICSHVINEATVENHHDGFYATVSGALLNIATQSLNILIEYETERAGTKLNDVTFSIVGDSISTFAGRLVSDWSDYSGAKYDAFYPNAVSDVDDVHKTWWHKLMVYTGMKLLNNCAWSGSQVCGVVNSTTSANSSASDKRCLDIGHAKRNPDIIIVNIGINDFANGNGYLVGNWNGGEIQYSATTLGDFSEAYALMLFKYMTIYPNARIFCCTLMEIGLFNRGANHNGELLKQYNDAIRRCAEGLGADVIDLHACGINYFNLGNYIAADGTHPKESGMELIAKKIESELLAKY